MSNIITCPNCGQKIHLDESDYAQILSQVSEEELAKRIHEHEQVLAAKHQNELLQAEAKARDEFQARLGEKDEELAGLKASLEATKAEKEGSLKVAAAEAEKLVAELRAKLEQAEQEAAHAAKALEDDKKLALASAKSEADAKLAEKDAKLAALEEQVKAQDAAQADAIKLAVADVEAKAASLQAKLEQAEQQARLAADTQSKERELALASAKSEADAKLAEKERKIAELEVRIGGMQEKFEAEKAAAIAAEEGRQNVKLSELQGAVQLAVSEKEQVEATLKQQMLEQERYKDQIIADKNAEIERIRDQKARLSTKLLGESLEQHCEIEFKKWRSTGFKNADFHKDTKAVEGEDGKATKGDYIFRECDEDGNEIISIMFEMKTEDDQSTNKKTNESHFKKLDEDRRKKGCEYAVLVSMLEPESDLYTGITDVSWAYEKMYVIRPQFFIPMITILRNAALTTMGEKRELAKIRQQNIDVTNFEAALNNFKERFSTDLEHAEKKFEAADDAIGKAIKSLEKWREEIRLVKVHLYKADKKVDDITVKKLTRGNPTMKAKFDEAREEANKITPTELPEEGESAMEPDSLE